MKMKNISSTTENFIREQIEIKFKKQIDALKKKKTVLDKKLHDLSDQIYKLDEQLSNVGELSELQEDKVYAIENDLVNIIKKACAKTIADRLKQIGLKMVNEEKTIECILVNEGLFDAINYEYIVNTENNADKIKKQLQKLTDQSDLIDKERENIKIEIRKINEKIDGHVKTIVVMLELGGNYDDLMKMINETKI